MKTVVVVPNWNGEDWLRECLDSLLVQSVPLTLVVVDNGSTDSSRNILESYGDKIIRIYRDKNYGFTGGVNPGIEYAIENDFDAVALFNNDAVADTLWLKELQKELHDDTGIVTCSLQTFDKKLIDSTGEQMTTWGLPYPRGRHTPVSQALRASDYIFGASGGATLYSVAMLREIGLFDDDFFAYYEDVDISYRAQLSGWKVKITPKSIAYHRINATSNRMKSGFFVYQTFKNLPMVNKKNTPKGLRHIVYPRFLLAYSLFYASAVCRGDIVPATKGVFDHVRLLPKKSRERKIIQLNKKVTNEYIWDILIHDLPENEHKLRKLRSVWWKIIKKRETGV